MYNGEVYKPQFMMTKNELYYLDTFNPDIYLLGRLFLSDLCTICHSAPENNYLTSWFTVCFLTVVELRNICFACFGRSKQMRMRWAGHVARIEGWEINTLLSLVNPKGRGHLEDLGVEGKKILKLILWKEDENLWTVCIWLRIGTSSRPLWTL